MMTHEKQERSTLDILLQMEIPEPRTRTMKVKRLSKLGGGEVTVTLKELPYSRIQELNRREEDWDVHMVLEGTVKPDYKNQELKRKYGAVTPAELVKKLYLPGEIVAQRRIIEELSGYRTTTLEDLEKKSEETQN